MRVKVRVRHDDELARILAKEAGIHPAYLKFMAVQLAKKLRISLPEERGDNRA